MLEIPLASFFFLLRSCDSSGESAGGARQEAETGIHKYPPPPPLGSYLHDCIDKNKSGKLLFRDSDIP